MLIAMGAALFGVTGCKDAAEADLNRCIALEAKEDWSNALSACEQAAQVSQSSDAGRLANGKAGLLREKVAAKGVWDELHGTTPDGDARGAIRALRTFWPIARIVGSANFRIAECQDTAKGYAAFKKCLDGAAEGISAGRGLLQNAHPIPGGCGKEIATTVAAYVSANEQWLESFKAWVGNNEAAFKRAMVGRSMTDACGEGLNCDAPDRSGPSFGSVSGIECTKTVFACGAPDNVCWANKVADRLGLGDGATGTLTVRATGVAIR